MTTMPDIEVFVTVGVDTHKDAHVAVALDQLGRFLDATEIPTTSAGYGDLLAWASELGTIDRVRIEGTGSHGAGLCRWLTARGVIVIEVDRPDRRLRRNKGKSDTIDAEAAARKVLSGEATAFPKAQDGKRTSTGQASHSKLGHTPVQGTLCARYRTTTSPLTTKAVLAHQDQESFRLRHRTPPGSDESLGSRRNPPMSVIEHPASRFSLRAHS